MALLDGKVVLVTGAGQGIGRAHALSLARAGARVLVNDLGGSKDGTGQDQGPAQAVVAEIRALGGEAVADTSSVTDPAGAERMVQKAQDTWGRLDAVVNNAGILRDVTFRKMEDPQWDAVLQVHLQGTYNVTKAAVRAFLAQQAGHRAIVNTSSYSGLIGNFGQSNYAAAKAGIYGFTRVLALELKKAGVTANCLAPVAKTRMTEGIDVVDPGWTPEHVSPVVVFLVSELGRDVTGRVFGVEGNRLYGYEMKLTDGVTKAGTAPWTAEEIARDLDAIFAWGAPSASAGGAHDALIHEAFAHVPGAYQAEKAGDFKATIHFAISDGPSKTIVCGDGTAQAHDGLVGTPDCTIKTDAQTMVGIMTATVDAQKAFMQGKITADNLAVIMKFAMFFRFGGPKAAVAPTAPDTNAPKAWPIGKIYDGGFSFVKPVHAEAYAAATGDASPTYAGEGAIAPPMFHVRLFKPLLFAIATDPELGLDMLRLVHGEHDATFHRPLRPWDLVHLRARLESVEEKSSGLLVTSKLFAFVEGELAVEAVTRYFIRAPKRKDEAAPKSEPRPEPEVPTPHFVGSIAVADDQSVRYAQASLDDNPIHIDPATAKAAGLPGVILQGLCTMAMSGVAVVRERAGGDPRRLRRLGVRFSAPVLNGTTLTLHGWDQPGGPVAFAVMGPDGKPVITGGVAEVVAG